MTFMIFSIIEHHTLTFKETLHEKKTCEWLAIRLVSHRVVCLQSRGKGSTQDWIFQQLKFHS